jgi:hypothetical protein
MVRLSALGFTLAAASVLVPGVLSQVPACATTCATSVATSTGCDLYVGFHSCEFESRRSNSITFSRSDTTCICGEAFATAAGACVETSCSAADATAAETYFEGLCTGAFVRCLSYRALLKSP